MTRRGSDAAHRWPFGLHLAVLLLAAAPASGTGSPPAQDTVAWVDGEPVSAGEVRAHVQPVPPRVGTAPPVDARQAALDEAVKVRLLAREGRRRGFKVSDGPAAIVEAQLVQQVIRDEVARRGLAGRAVSDEEARRFHDAHLVALSAVEQSDVAAIVVQDAALAEKLLAQAAPAGDREFGRLVEQHSLEAGRSPGGHLARIDRHGQALPAALLRVARALKTPGAVGLAQSTDGRYYVLRATRVQLEEKPWTPARAHYVRELMASLARDEAVTELAAGLRRAATVKVDVEALQRVPVPTWEEFLGLGS